MSRQALIEPPRIGGSLPPKHAAAKAENITTWLDRREKRLATAREESRSARAAPFMVIDARDTAWMSWPTTNRSRTLLPFNRATNSGGSIEK